MRGMRNGGIRTGEAEAYSRRLHAASSDTIRCPQDGTFVDMLWLKAFHIIAVVTWFAGLFYLPRLLVYHAEASEPVVRERLKIMERRLLAMTCIGSTLTVVFGVATLLWAANVSEHYF